MTKQKSMGDIAMEAWQKWWANERRPSSMWDAIAIAVISEHERRKRAKYKASKWGQLDDILNGKRAKRKVKK